MRLIGPVVVILAIALSSGGVAYRSQAEPAASTHADAGQCRVDAAAPTGMPAPVDITGIEERASKKFRALSGTGYNYPEPGTWHPEVATRKRAPALPAAPEPAN